MAVKFNPLWLLIGSCIVTSACTEEIIVQEAPVSASDSLLSDEADEELINPLPGSITTDNKASETNLTASSTNNTNVTLNGGTSPTSATSPTMLSTIAPGSASGNSTTNPMLTPTGTETPAANMVNGINTTLAPTILPIDEQQTGAQDLLPVETGDTLLADSIIPDTAIDTERPAEIMDELVNMDSMVIGEPGMQVDCLQQLPCQWLSADTQMSVTITNADNIGAQNRLSIEYSVLTSHDSELSIASTEAATDTNAVRYDPFTLTLGEGIGGIVQGVSAGSSIAGRIEFDSSSSAEAISNWTIGLSDSGIVRQPQFANIPIGSATTLHADCANTIPCAWVSPDGQTTITLMSVTGFGSTFRLSANFKVETTSTKVVAVDNGSTAVGIDGLRYEGRTHAIGTDTGAEKITATAIPGSQVAATIFFFRTQRMSPSLQNLSLIVYEDSPVPRWNPSFLSVPVR